MAAHPPRKAPPTHRTGLPHPEQLALADDLHTRALALRAASEDGISIREAVALAAVQLGLEPAHAPEEQQ